MIQHDAWFFPDGETQLPRVMTKINHRVEGRLTFQYHKYKAALGLCAQRRVAVDVGAHVGLWSYWMARDFQYLAAFEPHPDHRECWAKNLAHVAGTDWRLYDTALGAAEGTITLAANVGESGGTHVAATGVAVPQCTLDSYAFPVIDLLKIDCEGYEPAVIAGATETIRRCRPVIVVEQYAEGRQRSYGFTATAAVDALRALGGRVVVVLGSDTIVRFD